MNIIISQKKLLEAIQRVERVITKNVSLPILGTILLQTEQGKLKLTATNLEIGMYCWVGAKIEKDGRVAVPARVFSDFISSIQDEKLEIKFEKNTLYINSDRYTTKILTMSDDEFPLIPKLKNTQEFSISTVDIHNALERVVDAASLLETRPELSGVYMDIKENTVTCAATDSFRLSEYIIKGKFSLNKSFIIPRATVIELLRITSGRSEDIIFSISENQIMARANDIELVSRLIDGRYPDYKKVIPENIKSSFSVSRQELERQVRMVSIFSSSISDLALSVADGKISLSAKNSDKGEISTQMPVTSTSSFSLSVNYRYLLDALKVISSDEIEISYSNEGNPLVIRGAHEEYHTYVIMPLRS